MSKIVSIHSFRGGTGKSNITANITALLALEGKRVGVFDTDIQSPGIHVLFGLAEDRIKHALNAYLRGEIDIEGAAYDVTANLAVPVAGQVFLVPSSLKSGEIARVLREDFDVSKLIDGYHQLIRALDLDVLMIDTHPGLNHLTLLSIAISDVLAIVLRPDAQDYQGTAVTVEVARKLEVPRMFLVINKALEALSPAKLTSRAEQAYDCEVAGVVPHADEMLLLASEDIFVLRYPDHPVTAQLKQVAARLVA